jgi:hypothetical protein
VQGFWIFSGDFLASIIPFFSLKSFSHKGFRVIQQTLCNCSYQ